MGLSSDADANVVQEGQFLDGWVLARHMGITERPFMVRFRTDVAPWSWRKDRFSHEELVELWRNQLGQPGVNAQYPLGIYIHVPFCTHSCAFCRCFRVKLGGRDILDQYVDFLCAQMDFFGPAFAHVPIRYFSVGGGTPTILDPNQLGRMFSRLRQRFDIRESPLATVEMSAPTMTDRTLQALVDNGIPRISVGVQTLDPRIRSANHMFRIEPTWLQGRVSAARGLGLHCNLDLVLGLPDEPADVFLDGFRRLIAMGPSSVIVNLLNRNYFERVTEEDAARGRDRSEYLRIVGEGMAEAAAKAGFFVYPHSNTIEAIAFFSPAFDAVAHANWPVLERLASGVLSVHVGTSVLGLGSICNLAVLPDWLIACHSDDLHFDPAARVFRTTRKEVFSILYPRTEDLGVDFDVDQSRLVSAAVRRFEAAAPELPVFLSEDEVCVQVSDEAQAEGVARIFVKVAGAGRTAYRRVGPFEISFNGEPTPRLMAVVADVEHALRAVLPATVPEGVEGADEPRARPPVASDVSAVRPDGATSHPKARDVMDRFDRIAVAAEDPLRGFRLRVALLEAGRTVLVFERGKERFRVRVGPASDPSPCYQRQGKFAFTYDQSDAMPASVDRDRIMAVVVRVIAGRSKVG